MSDAPIKHFSRENYDVVIVSGKPPARQEAVMAAAANAVENILKTHTKAEAVAKLDYLKRVLDLADREIRNRLIPEVKDCSGMDAYEHWTVSAAKKKAKYQFPDNDMHLLALRKTAQAAKEDVEDYEEVLIRNGKAVDLNANEYTIVTGKQIGRAHV